MIKRLIILLCLSSGSLPAVATDITSDVIYGHKDGMALIYDVFTPAEPNGAAVAWMVSGGWFSNWRPPVNRLPRFKPLLDAGFTVFAVHHGSAPRFKVPDAVSDVRAAIRHIREHAADYGIDPARLGVWGGSAGGHLSLVLGLDPAGKPKQPTGEGRARLLAPNYAVDADKPAPVASVVAYYPPADLRSRVGRSERFPALDFPPAQAAAISPLLLVDAGDPPVLLIHGDKDRLVPLTDSRLLAAEFKKRGVPHELMIIEGAGHGFRDPGHRARAAKAMVAWFERTLAAD